jgi:hypothetical protein
MSMCGFSTYRNYLGACIKVAKEAALCHGWTLGIFFVVQLLDIRDNLKQRFF